MRFVVYLITRYTMMHFWTIKLYKFCKLIYYGKGKVKYLTLKAAHLRSTDVRSQTQSLSIKEKKLIKSHETVTNFVNFNYKQDSHNHERSEGAAEYKLTLEL